MDIPLPPVSKIVELFNSFENYKSFPIVHYVVNDREPKLVDTPQSDLKIESYVLSLGSSGIVIHVLPTSENPVVEGYQIRNGVAIPSPPLPVVDRILRALVNGELSALTTHEIKALSILTTFSEEDISRELRRARLEKELEDKNVVIFNDFLVVLSKKRGLVRYDGAEAVEVAKRVAFVHTAPISTIANHIRKLISEPAVLIRGAKGSVLCSERCCVQLPLPPNLVQLVVSAMKIRVEVAERGRRIRCCLPKHCDAVAVSGRSLYYLKREGRDRYRPVERIDLQFAFDQTLVVTPNGVFLGRFLIRGAEPLIEVAEFAEGAEEEKGCGEAGGADEEHEEYLEEVVLGS